MAETLQDVIGNAIKTFMRRPDTKVANKSPAKSAFKAHGDYWYSEWTNNLEDRDAEFFSGKSIKDYVARVDIGLTPKPDLWVWHAGKESKIGTSTEVGYTEKEGVVIAWAVGRFDDSPRAQAAKDYYNSSDEIHGTSHGFVYPSDRKQGRVYQSFNTFELTVLPPEVASNPYASFESKEFQMNEKKYEYLVKVFGETEAAKIKAEQETKASTLSQIAEYKEFFSIEDAVSGKDEKEHNHAADSETETALKQIVADVIPEMGDLASGQLSIMKKVKEQSSMIDKLIAENKAMKKQMADMEAELKAKPRAASEDDETEVTDPDMLDKLKKKEAGEKDSFWTPFISAEKA